jgi:flagellar basal-body rod modification protein FlgD
MLASEITAIPTAATEQSTQTKQMGQEDFLRMLIAQLENQDPLDPQEATEFTAQLAQFSTLEQLISMRAAVEDLAAGQGSSQALATAGLIGRQVLAETTDFDLPLDGEQPALYLEVPDGAEVDAIEVVDGNGRVVARTGSLGALAPGLKEIAWGEFSPALAPGLYSVRVRQTDGPLATALLQARVTGVSVSGDTPVLLLGEAIVPLSGVREVRE